MENINSSTDNNLNENEMQNEMQNEMLFKCVVIKDFSDNFIRYDLVHSSMVNDLISFISKLPMECFFQNYKLEIEKTGKTILPEDNLYELDIKEFDVIKMVPTLYDYSSSKAHFDTVKYMLNEHPFFTGISLLNNQEIIFRDYDKLVEVSKKKFADLKDSGIFLPFFKYLVDENSFGGLGGMEEDEENMQQITDKNNEDTNENKNKEISDNKKENVEKQVEELINRSNKPEKVNKKVNLEEIKQKILNLDYKKFNLNNLPNSYIYESSNKPIKYRCLNAIFLSAFNGKLETNEAPKGDLLYIEVITLENNHYCITNSERGFFVNNSKNNVYDPSPLQSGYTSFTLPGILSLLSLLFKENFSKTLSQNITGDDLFFLPSPMDKNDWIVPVENPFSYNYRYKSMPEHKNEVSMNREWNEEYQGILDIKNLEGINLETRERLLVPFYQNFKEVAIQGAKLIANKKIKPFSMSDSPTAGYYIYGNIFITILENSPDFTVSLFFHFNIIYFLLLKIDF
jgi:hypothetical protein